MLRGKSKWVTVEEKPKAVRKAVAKKTTKKPVKKKSPTKKK
jgi:hypothetical protein